MQRFNDGSSECKSGSDQTGLERIRSPCVDCKVPRSQEVGSHMMVTNILNQTAHTADAKSQGQKRIKPSECAAHP